MPNRLEWHGEQAKAHVRGLAVKAIRRAAIVCKDRAKELLNVAGTGGVKGSRRSYGSNPSAPGEPPHKQLGRLRASVTYEVDEPDLTARVGTNLPYGLFLELGTSRGLAPRPWLRRALAETAARINSILSGGG